MAKEKKKWWYGIGLLAFIIYVFAAASPIPRETVLRPRWIASLESNTPVSLGDYSARINTGQKLLPFSVGSRFGYVEEDGSFALSRIKTGYVSLSEDFWTEYDASPSSIKIMNPAGEPALAIENAGGYPLFLDSRIFIIGNEQNSITAFGRQGEELWTYDFHAPITCVDAAGGFVLAGTIDGAAILLNSSGNPAFIPFEPGGSRLSVILGCAISRDASSLAIISGVDNQRFLLLERSGDSYKVTYHEFLGSGFRRPVHVSFVDGDSKVAFEREGGLAVYDINARAGISLNLEGEITVLDNSGGGKFLYLITTQGAKQKRFVIVRYPAYVVNEVPFKSDNAFFGRRENTLFLAGDYSMVSFELEKK
jgi:hypothetical protein